MSVLESVEQIEAIYENAKQKLESRKQLDNALDPISEALTKVLTVDKEGIQSIFAQRREEIEEEKKEAEVTSTCLDNEIHNLVSEFQERLTMLVQKTSTPTKPKLTYVLKKLPMFGRSDNLEFKNYFEYPSQ